MLFVPKVYSAEAYTPVELSVYLYADGVAEIEYKVDVDPTMARVNITLFGDTYEDFIVRDQDNSLLDYDRYPGYSTIDILGSISAEIGYTTHDLTNKTRSLWTLSLYTPVNMNLQLPEGASILSLAPTPLSIEIVESKAIVIMPPGDVAVSYLLGTAGTKENALLLIKEAEGAIEDAQIKGIIVVEAESLLQQAYIAYEEAQYSEAEQLASQSKNSLETVVSLALEAETALKLAESSITIAKESKRTSLLDQATQELQQAQEAYDSGQYAEAKIFAEQAAITAQKSKSSNGSSLPQFLLLGALIVAVGVLYKLYGDRKSDPVQNSEEEFRVDVESIFNENSSLRLDEKAVIRYMAENKGGAFSSEIRERFDIPRSSTWRMIKRFERDEIVVTKIIGRETYVQINPKYAIGKAEEE